MAGSRFSFFESQNKKIKFVSIDSLESSLRELHPGVSISKGQFISHMPSTVRDLEWNHMDQNHRLYLHDAYHDSLRLATGSDFAYSLTRWKNLPVFIQVFDIHLGPGLFYQSFGMFGLLVCHQVQRMQKISDEVAELRVDWMTVSHWLLKPLHGIFNRMMLNLEVKQDSEDLVVRQTRSDLRKEGFSFLTDQPDFHNSNLLSDMVIFPTSSLPIRAAATDVVGGEGEVRTLKMGPFRFFAQRDGDGILVWPGTCPHEGARLETSHFCEKKVVCPWHGRTFSSVRLVDGGRRAKFGNIQMTLTAGVLVLEAISSEMVLPANHLVSNKGITLPCEAEAP